MIKPPWLRLAMGEIGVKELREGSNPVIDMYWKDSKIKLPEGVAATDDVPWCSAFVCAMLERSGQISTRSSMARSFSRARATFSLCGPRIGAIAVISSPPSKINGHVFFLTSLDANMVCGVGGNQSNSVSEACFDRRRLIGLYWPKSYQINWESFPIVGKPENQNEPDQSDR